MRPCIAILTAMMFSPSQCSQREPERYLFISGAPHACPHDAASRAAPHRLSHHADENPLHDELLCRPRPAQPLLSQQRRGEQDGILIITADNRPFRPRRPPPQACQVLSRPCYPSYNQNRVLYRTLPRMGDLPISWPFHAK